MNIIAHLRVGQIRPKPRHQHDTQRIFCIWIGAAQGHHIRNHVFLFQKPAAGAQGPDGAAEIAGRRAALLMRNQAGQTFGLEMNVAVSLDWRAMIDQNLKMPRLWRQDHRLRIRQPHIQRQANNAEIMLTPVSHNPAADAYSGSLAQSSISSNPGILSPT